MLNFLIIVSLSKKSAESQLSKKSEKKSMSPQQSAILRSHSAKASRSSAGSKHTDPSTKNRTQSDLCVNNVSHKSVISERVDVPIDDNVMKTDSDKTDEKGDRETITDPLLKFENTPERSDDVYICMAKFDPYQNVSQALIQAQDEVLEALNRANSYVLSALNRAGKEAVRFIEFFKEYS